MIDHACILLCIQLCFDVCELFKTRRHCTLTEQIYGWRLGGLERSGPNRDMLCKMCVMREWKERNWETDLGSKFGCFFFFSSSSLLLRVLARGPVRNRLGEQIRVLLLLLFFFSSAPRSGPWACSVLWPVGLLRLLARSSAPHSGPRPSAMRLAKVVKKNRCASRDGVVRAICDERALNGLSMLCDCFVDALWVIWKCFVNALWMFCECFVSILRVLCEYFVSAVWVLCECSVNAFWMFCEFLFMFGACFVNAFWVLCECFEHAPMNPIPYPPTSYHPWVALSV